MVKYSSDKLLQILSKLPETDCYLVAYSGGMDSHVLLASLAALGDRLDAEVAAIHVNHGLSPNAGDWAEHCRTVSNGLGIDLAVVEIDAANPRGESPESWARRQRYAALQKHAGPGHMLLTAHHKDDQAETLLLQLFRGAGPDGLSAMPVTQVFGTGWHCRPLLDLTRQELRDYAVQAGLDWIEDESNSDTGLDRNYIRHRIIPVIGEHWPGMTETLSRASRHQAEAAELQAQLAALDLAGHTDETGRKLELNKLKELSDPRQKNLLRHWLQTLNLPVPDSRTLQHIIQDVVNSRQDASPCVTWKGAEVRRFRDRVYALAPLCDHDPEQVLAWNLEHALPVAHGKLIAHLEKGRGIRAAMCEDRRMEIRYRHGGEAIQPAGQEIHHDLKKLFQEHAVPPWLRDRVPLIYIGNRLASVPGKWIDQEFYGKDDEDCWQIIWEGSEEIFSK